MFLGSSRYAKVKTTRTEHPSGREVEVVTLRRLPYVPGEPVVVKDNDRLDIMAQRRFKDPTMFWRVADANTELEANDLIRTGRTINVPEK